MRPPKCRRRRAGAICGGTAPRRDRPANSTGGRCPANSTSGHCPAPALRVGNGRRGRGPGLWRRTDGHGAAAPSAAMTTSGALHFPGTAPILGVRRPPATTVLCARYAGSGPCRQHMGRPPPPAAARRRPPPPAAPHSRESPAPGSDQKSPLSSASCSRLGRRGRRPASERAARARRPPISAWPCRRARRRMAPPAFRLCRASRTPTRARCNPGSRRGRAAQQEAQGLPRCPAGLLPPPPPRRWFKSASAAGGPA